MIDQVVEVRDGKVFWRGVYKTRDEATRMRDYFAATTDWFAPTAHDYADQLTRAMEAVDVH